MTSFSLLLVINLSIIQQWIQPTVANTMAGLGVGKENIIYLATRTIKLALPNNVSWLLFFYMYFHSFLNATAEILRFGDRQFYRDWWNASTVQYFWKNWNIPVHKWLLRHIYRPMRAKGFSRNMAVLGVFALSAILHEVAVSVPLGLVRGYSFAGMIVYVPLAAGTTMMEKSGMLSEQWGNVIVWSTLLLGQPLGVLMYVEDYLAKV